MQYPILNGAAARENAQSLASALGIEPEQADELLSTHVLITAEENDAANLLASQIRELLQRTITSVSREICDVSPAIELLIGRVLGRSDAQKIWVNVDPKQAIISRIMPESLLIHSLHPALSLVVACYSAGAALVAATNDKLASPSTKSLILDLGALATSNQLSEPVDIGRAYLAGAGAIGNGVLWALRYFSVSGELDVVMFDVVKEGNLNRQLWFTKQDVGKPKAEALVARAQAAFPRLILTPRVSSLQDLPEKKSDEHWLRRLLVAVDSRRARRSLQSELPREVFDASTTDIREIVLHYNKQPNHGACMGCIYPPDAAEGERARHVAESLGVSVEEVQEGTINAPSARRIMARYHDRGLTENMLVGEAYDSLFKTLCAQSALETAEGRQVFAPFAFISVLAGTLLVIDMFRRLKGEGRSFNLWTVSPWFPFSTRLQRQIEPSHDCQVCSVPVIRAVSDQLWSASS